MLLSPLWLALLLGLALLVLEHRHAARRTRWLLWIGWIACCFVMTPLGANAFVSLYANLFRTPACTDVPDTIVVLGGGFDRSPESDSDYAVFLPGTYERLIAGIKLQQAEPQRRLVLVGGGDFRVSEAVVMARFAQRFGVAAERITVEKASRSTWENAQLTRALEPRLPERIALVTSALHMPRAHFTFRREGFDVCAQPSGRLYFKLHGATALLPQRSALQKTEAALHEIAGFAAYRLRDWNERNERNEQSER